MTYKVASKLTQSKLGRIIPRSFQFADTDKLTDEEYLKRLRTHVTKLEQQLFSMRRDDDRRRDIAIQKQKIADEIQAFKGTRKKKGPGALANKFMDVVRRHETKAKFEFFLKIANQELEEEL